jgi:cell division septation protein DedD
MLGVAITTTILLGLSRWSGRLVSGRLPARTADHGAAEAGAAAGTPDLTFYRALGGATAPGRHTPAPPPDPALRPAPGDLVAPGGAFVVQVLATNDEAQAKRLRDRLASRGYPASIAEDESGPAPVWRVRLGRWRERGPAEAMAGKVRKQEGLEPWVLQEQAP